VIWKTLIRIDLIFIVYFVLCLLCDFMLCLYIYLTLFSALFSLLIFVFELIDFVVEIECVCVCNHCVNALNEWSIYGNVCVRLIWFWFCVRCVKFNLYYFCY